MMVPRLALAVEVHQLLEKPARRGHDRPQCSIAKVFQGASRMALFTHSIIVIAVVGIVAMMAIYLSLYAGPSLDACSQMMLKKAP